MEKELEELVNNRKQLIEIHKKNKFTNGIHNLLTDMYPDIAHFIYELLQNAEDMNATEVYFHLYSDGIDFEHNGTKRNFNIKDIDAITNIGNNPQKKDDVTCIGKFGVGFKAVFAYTATPEIHSGQYHFRIRDYFVPEFDNVEHISVTDEDGVSWTKFRFPFNNPEKPLKIAYKEVLNGLKELNGDSILFLQNIQLIEYQINDDDIRTVKKEKREDHIYRVTYYNDEKDINYYSDWLCFTKLIEITDEQGNHKSLPIAVAYHLDYNEDRLKYSITPAFKNGKTFIYFPAEKENSGLRFYINAPFASTVARDSIRNCPENSNLIKDLANLVVESLLYIKEKGWLNYDFLNVLPNNNDDLGMFVDIRSRVFLEFKGNKLLPYNGNTYIRSYDAIICDNELSELFPDKEEFTSLTGIDKYLYVLPEGQRARVFIQNVVGNNFTNKEFEKLIAYNPSRLSAIIKTRSENWLLDFYKRILSNFKTYRFGRGWIDYPKYNCFKDMLKNVFLIRGADDKYYKPDDISILKEGVNLITEDTAIIKPSLLLDNDALKLFEILEIKEYGPEVEVEKILSNYNRFEFKVTEEQYYKDLLSLSRYLSNGADIDLSKYCLFRANNKRIVFLYPASRLYLGKCYNNPDGDILSEKLETNTLWDGYIDVFNDEEIIEILQLVEKCGIKKGLEIVEVDVHKNPYYEKKLAFTGRNETKNARNQDYTIPQIEMLLNLKDIEISRIIWNTLYSMKSANKSQAKYAPNASTGYRSCDSLLVYHLKNYEWIPDKNGVFHKPQDITEEELPDDFTKNDLGSFYNSVLYSIDLGKLASEETNEKKHFENYAKKNNKEIVDKTEWNIKSEKAAKYDEMQAKKKKYTIKKSSSVDDIFAAQTKKQKKNINDGDDFTGSGAVNNKERRERNIAATFKEKSSEKDSVQRKLFSKIVESNKEEKLTLKNWYNGHCQMCDRFIIGWDGEMHFEARNIIITSHLDNEIRNTLGLAWNSLCLCPFCAAKFEVCSRNMEDMPEQIRKQEIYNGDDERIIITMELAEERQEISFVPKHFLALQKGLQLLDEYLKNNNEI